MNNLKLECLAKSASGTEFYGELPDKQYLINSGKGYWKVIGPLEFSKIFPGKFEELEAEHDKARDGSCFPGDGRPWMTRPKSKE